MSLSCFADARDGVCASLYVQGAKTSNNVQLGGTTLLLCYPVVHPSALTTVMVMIGGHFRGRAWWDGCVLFPPLSLQASLFALSRCILFPSAMAFFGPTNTGADSVLQQGPSQKSKTKPERPTIGHYIDASEPCTQSKAPFVHIGARARPWGFFSFVLCSLFFTLGLLLCLSHNLVCSNDGKNYAFLSLTFSSILHRILGETLSIYYTKSEQQRHSTPLIYPKRNFVTVNSLKPFFFIHLCFAFCVLLDWMLLMLTWVWFGLVQCWKFWVYGRKRCYTNIVRPLRPSPS